MPKPVARRRCMLEENVLTIGLDADHALGVKGAPCSIALLCLAEIPAANDIGLCSGRAGSLDFLAIARVKLDGAHHAISLVNLHADEAAASVGDELEDEGGLVHGKKQRRASRPVREEYQQTARKRGLAAPASHFVTKRPSLTEDKEGMVAELLRLHRNINKFHKIIRIAGFPQCSGSSYCPSRCINCFNGLSCVRKE